MNHRDRSEKKSRFDLSDLFTLHPFCRDQHLSLSLLQHLSLLKERNCVHIHLWRRRIRVKKKYERMKGFQC